VHIPDGFLDTKTWTALSAASLAAASVSVVKARKRIGEKSIPMMGTMAAFVFASQMINIPVAGGTSGHFVGAALISILLGPWAGFLVMSVVLAVQCLLFQDGGLTALGANIFNMGLVGCFGSWMIYHALKRLPGGAPAASFIAGWSSTIIAAIFVSAELAASGTIPLRVVLPAMAGVHAVIGVLEGLVTAGVLGFIIKVRPDLAALEGAIPEQTGG
jgi:cobalt/nickel transport system permease protein